DVPAGPVELTATARYQSCNDSLCLPPKRKPASATLTIDPTAKFVVFAIPSGYSEFRPLPSASASAGAAPPVAAAQTQPQSSDFGIFLLAAFGAGLAAIFTPCVFPMIPFTVSYFMNRQTGDRRDGVLQAILFCGGIIVLFTGLGAATKAIAGPFG